MDLYYYIMIWVCVLGLCLGSFYNVVILRSLSGESIVFPPSKCPKCGHKLYPWHNIPVLSYIFLRGKCAFCKEKISIQYPIIELLTMFMFLFSYIKFGISYTTLFIIIWLSCLIIMTVTDIKEKLVDCNIAIVMGISGLIFAFINGGMHGLFHSLLGAIAGILIMELIARSGFIFAKTRAMGEADTYVAAALGAVFGIFLIVKVLLYSLFASMIFVLPVFLYNRFKLKDILTCISFAVFAASACCYEWLWQNYYTYALLAVSGIILVYSILKGLREKHNINYLPYVPALSAAAVFCIFFVI